MTRSLLITLLFCPLAFAGEFEQRIAIALELAKEQPQEQTVVVEKPEPIPAPEQEQPRYEMRRVKKTRMVRQKFCTGRGCYYKLVPQTYYVQERVQVSGPKPQPKREPQADAYYPVRGRWWTLQGKTVSADHLLTHPKHRNDPQVDPTWLRSLSHEELQSYHSDLHEGRAKLKYVHTKGNR